MRAGIVLPRDQRQVPAMARWAEEQGFDHVACGEHLFFHGRTANTFVVLAAAAGATVRIRLLSALTILPVYPAVLAAKLAATLDQVSSGRSTSASVSVVSIRLSLSPSACPLVSAGLGLTRHWS